MSNPAFDYSDEELTGGDGSSSFRDLRNHAKALEKELKQKTKEVEALQSFKQDVEAKAKRDSLSETFTNLGLNPKQADLFFKTRTEDPESDEINPEDIKLWALDYGLISAEQEEEGEGDPVTSQFTPVPRAAGGPPSSRTLTSDEWNDLLQTNPEEAMQMAQEGRVEFANSL